MTGRTVGNLEVGKLVRRDAAGAHYEIRCRKCGATWSDSERRIVDGFLAQGCRNTPCRLGRLEPTKITAHEHWLNSPDVQPESVTTPEPKPASERPLTLGELIAERERG